MGGITLSNFLTQLGTGFCLTFFYRPVVAEAFSSIEFLSEMICYGWGSRSLHRWSGTIMIIELAVHVSRVYLTGGFRQPRELIWLTGVLTSLFSVTFGVTGYSLPWDQAGFWACKIVTGIPESIPLLGELLVKLTRGSYCIGQLTLTRFYSTHTFLLPILTTITLLVHFTLIRKCGISGPS